MKRIFLISILSVFILSGCWANDIWYDISMKFSGDGKLPEKKIELLTAAGKTELIVEVADSEEEREKGLMEREKLESGRGMLFIFEDEAPRNFWMKNTKIPLDIIFFSAKKEIVSFVEWMDPCKTPQCPGYSSGMPAMYALEVPTGFIKEKAVRIGDKFAEKAV
ncbi:DUF192 domain-containing protein [Candidatus Peregrinibacteria bacterium]|nr:DUF192 domain-containing protein [Candidatus Peregrinibacteria bacterium]